MRILHILSTPRAEGTPNLVLDWLATGLHEQDVYVLNSQPADLTARLRSAARWYGEGNHFSRRLGKFFAITAGVWRVCREQRPDVVICWPTGFAGWVCLGARLGGVKHILVHCGNPPTRSGKHDWITRYVMWPLMLLRAKCVCCSNYVRDQYRSVPLVSRRLFHTVYNCARAQEVAARAVVARERRQDEGRPRCVGIMVATLERHKDHETLFKALPFILRARPEFQLRLVGDGSIRSQLEDLALNLGIQKAVEFLGTRRDVPEQLSQADVFIFSTTPQEGLGSVLLEALAAGLPIVASDVPACRELLADGRFGALTPPREPQLLAEAVLRVCGSERGNSEAGIQYALSFDPQSMIKNYLDIACSR